jgi:hypothetical protein
MCTRSPPPLALVSGLGGGVRTIFFLHGKNLSAKNLRPLRPLAQGNPGALTGGNTVFF